MECNLCCKDETHPPIKLFDKTPLVLGRSPLTKIVDPRCSRNQVEVTAFYKSREVIVKQLGGNSSNVGDTTLNEGMSEKMREGSTLYIVSGLYPHYVKFSSPRSSGSDKPKNNDTSTNKGVNNSGDAGANISRTSVKNDVCKVDKHNGKRKVDESPEFSNSNSKKKVKLAHDSSKHGHSSKSKDVTSFEFEDDEDETEHLKKVDDKLKYMKENAINDVKLKQSHKKAEKSSDSDSHADNSVVLGQGKWEKFEKMYVFTQNGVEGRSKIAAFDIDGTIITTLSGKVFPVDSHDWKIMLGEAPAKIRKLHSDGYKIVFFTNQMGVAKGKVKLDDVQRKIVDILERIKVPVQVFVATGTDRYRKPCPGMWRFLTKCANGGVKVQLESCFYVGDAAGRPEKWANKKKKDFSCSDRLFALNIGLKFHTPEEFFQGHSTAPFNLPEFNPKKLSENGPLLSPSAAALTSHKPEVIITVGLPASGKSQFAKEHLEPKGYVYVNRDTLGSWQKCVAECTKALKINKSVVVDNTNPDQESRFRYLDVAKKFGVSCRCFHFPLSLEHCKHNERFRELTDPSHKPVVDMIMHSYRKKFVEPSMKEGFDEVVKVNFVPKFKSAEHKRLYTMFLIEK